MIELTLDETWEKCLKMWRWIVKQIKLHPYSNVEVLKRKWLKKYGFGKIYNDCFFCDYTFKHASIECDKCPAFLVDRYFHCTSNEYCWEKKPAEFLKKITELNKQRLKQEIK